MKEINPEKNGIMADQQDVGSGTVDVGSGTVPVGSGTVPVGSGTVPVDPPKPKCKTKPPCVSGFGADDSAANSALADLSFTNHNN